MAHRLEYESIYEIIRACRLCGANDGYKMPIIQNILPYVSCDMGLVQKIRECVQIEVNEKDNMPPLICEPCMIKVCDFYEFLCICRETNKRTRHRLGLPPQNCSQLVSDTEDSILGVTEQISPKTNPTKSTLKPGPLKRTLVRSVRINKEDTDKTDRGKAEMEWSVRGNSDRKGGKGKKDEQEEVRKEAGGKRWLKELQELQMHVNYMDTSRTSRYTRQDSRSSSVASRSRVMSSPAPPARRSGANDPDTEALNHLRHQEFQNKTETPTLSAPKPILKKEKHIKKEPLSDGETQEVARGKRTRDKDVKLDTPPKKVKLNAPPSPTPKPSTKPGPKFTKPGPKFTKPGPKFTKPGPKFTKPGPKCTKPGPDSTKMPPVHTCAVCQQNFKRPQAYLSHMRCHVPIFTKPTLACDPCGEWFCGADEAAEHHARHRHRQLPYCCRRCERSFAQRSAYDEHLNQCVLYETRPELKCDACSKSFLTDTLMRQHNCALVRPETHQCSNCSHFYSSAKSLSAHRRKCLKKKALSRPVSEQKIKIEASVRRRLKPAQVRLVRCDRLLGSRRGRYDVSDVTALFGLDKSCVYPYLYGGVRVKSEPLDFDGMVSIKQDVRDELYKEEDYVHWDSDLSTDSEEEEADSDVENPLTKAKKVDSLTTLSLKTIFSKRCLGKVPRKLRRVKSEKLFDSMFNAGEFENDATLNNSINNIIGSLDDGDDSVTVNLTSDNDSSKVIFNDDVSIAVNYDSDSMLDPDRSILNVTNNDFDSLFNNKDETTTKYVTNDDASTAVNDDSDSMLDPDRSILNVTNNNFDSLKNKDETTTKVVTNDDASTAINDDSNSMLDPDRNILNVTNNDFDSLKSKDETTTKVVTNDDASTAVNDDSVSMLDPGKLNVTNNDFDSLKNNDETNDEHSNDLNDKDSKDVTNSHIDSVNNVEETDTPVQNVGSPVIKDFNANDGDTHKTEEDKDTVSLNSQISDRTEYDSASQNGDIPTNDISEKDSVSCEKVNGKFNDNSNDIISAEVENKLLDELIGENDREQFTPSESDRAKEKLTLDDIVCNNDLKSLDLDNISDEEFNFDV